MLRCPITISALLCLVATLALVNRTHGACSQFGHSCFGGHGKRSGSLPSPPLLDYTARDLLQRFASESNINSNNNADDDYIPNFPGGDSSFDEYDPNSVNGLGLSGGADDFGAHGFGIAGEGGKHATSFWPSKGASGHREPSANVLDRLMMLTSYPQRNVKRSEDLAREVNSYEARKMLSSLPRAKSGGSLRSETPRLGGPQTALTSSFGRIPSDGARSQTSFEEYTTGGLLVAPRLEGGIPSNLEAKEDLRKWLGRMQRQLLQHQPALHQQQQHSDLASARTQQQQQEQQKQTVAVVEGSAVVGAGEGVQGTANTLDY